MKAEMYQQKRSSKTSKYSIRDTCQNCNQTTMHTEVNIIHVTASALQVQSQIDVNYIVYT